MVRKLIHYFQIFKSLSLFELGNFVIYQFQKRSGLLVLKTPSDRKLTSGNINIKEFPLPEPDILCKISGMDLMGLTKHANRIVEGKYCAFGMIWKDLSFSDQNSQQHWIKAEKEYKCQDIKWEWEAARFGWAFILARAYWITKDEKYTDAFWKFTHDFFQKNPVNRGIHWASGQEIGLRFIALLFAYNVFRRSTKTSSDDADQLCAYLYEHARRIPQTIRYAAAQNNNHLFTEAVCMITASLVFNENPNAKVWRESGERWLSQCIKNQFYPDGAYIQQSTNYHRLVLQLFLWLDFILNISEEVISPEVLESWRNATIWLMDHVDHSSGKMVNLGHNDGALILPLTTCHYRDARPTLQGSCIRTEGKISFDRGPWDELACWLMLSIPDQTIRFEKPENRLYGDTSWVSIRNVRYISRPAHADQNHVELWKDGDNILIDPGTYAYNLPVPWDNRLAGTQVHNTIMVNNADQMTRAGKFRWVNWSNGFLKKSKDLELSASHDGYQKYNIIHERNVILADHDQWHIVDILRKIDPANSENFLWQIHYLVKDCDFNLHGDKTVDFRFENFMLKMGFSGNLLEDSAVSIYRAGERIYGDHKSGIEELFGWFSPTYGKRIPALSVVFGGESVEDLKVSTIIKIENC